MCHVVLLPQSANVAPKPGRLYVFPLCGHIPVLLDYSWNDGRFVLAKPGARRSLGEHNLLLHAYLVSDGTTNFEEKILY